MNKDNNMDKLQMNSVWFWNGSKTGRGVKHSVISLTEDEVITYSDYQCNKTSEGYTWAGSPKDFLLQFKFITLQNFN